jgi:Prokaryotic E2 family E
MIPEFLSGEIEQLRAKGYTVEVTEAEGWFNVVFPNYPLPSGFNKAVTQLLIKLPLSYRNGKPDMFWVDEDLTLKNGSVPRSGDSIEPALGRKWRRFSWHPQNWNPASDNLTTYLEFVNNRLSKAV